MMGLRRVNHTHRKPFMDETRSQTHPIRSGCFHDHEDLAWYNAGRLELVQKTGIAFGRLLDRKRPTGFRPGRWVATMAVCAAISTPTKSVYVGTVWSVGI